jgi:hypothetical protein
VVTGYTPADDGRPLDSKLRKLWPSDQPGVGAAQQGHEQVGRPRTVVEPPSKTGKRKTRKVKPPATPGPYKQSRSTPGGKAQTNRSNAQKGK